MARKLARNVHVPASDGSPERFFRAGEEPTKGYADQITNPKAWGEGEKARAREEGDSSEDTSTRRTRRS